MSGRFILTTSECENMLARFVSEHGEYVSEAATSADYPTRGAA